MLIVKEHAGTSVHPPQLTAPSIRTSKPSTTNEKLVDCKDEPGKQENLFDQFDAQEEQPSLRSVGDDDELLSEQDVRAIQEKPDHRMAAEDGEAGNRKEREMSQ